MKTFILSATFFFASFASFAQHDHSSHQTESSATSSDAGKTPSTNANGQKQFSQLLSFYYNIKNALVRSDGNSAASNAEEFAKTANTIDYKVISEGKVNLLATDARKISETKDVKKQREYFVNFSSNMAAVAKALKLSDQPVYLQYCPMKKASWLSADKAIKNPYYGSSMLTCGQVAETL